MVDVIVIGGGIIGLTAAVRLREAGLDVTVWAATGPDDTVSAVSAAIWYPTRTDFRPRLRDWALSSYDVYTRHAEAGAPGMLLRPSRTLERRILERRTLTPGAGEERPWWAPEHLEVLAGPEPYAREVRFTAPLAEMTHYLPWLASSVRVERRRVSTLDEALAAAPVVVNAAGIAAGALAGDDTVFPARGHVVLVRNPGLRTSVRVAGEPSTYVHPRRHDVVLGGTFEAGRWDLTPEPATRAAILARCAELVPELAGAEVLGVRVGLRPCRAGGPRVERAGAVVHAYGHGGAGMTLAWGTADEVTRLVMHT